LLTYSIEYIIYDTFKDVKYTVINPYEDLRAAISAF